MQYAQVGLADCYFREKPQAWEAKLETCEVVDPHILHKIGFNPADMSSDMLKYRVGILVKLLSLKRREYVIRYDESGRRRIDWIGKWLRSVRSKENL